jgi:hypothetical protein
MVSPVYALEQWLANALGIHYEFPLLAIVFALFLVFEPVLLIGIASWLTRVLSNNGKPLLSIAIRYSYALAPLGFGMWLAHFSFHFLTGLYTFVPVIQSAVGFLGEPRWGVPGLAPNVVQLFEFGFITLGLLGSLLVSYAIATAEESRPVRVFIVWAGLSVIIAAGAFWLMSQPMEMRAIALGSG